MNILCYYGFLFIFNLVGGSLACTLGMRAYFYYTVIEYILGLLERYVPLIAAGVFCNVLVYNLFQD